MTRLAFRPRAVRDLYLLIEHIAETTGVGAAARVEHALRARLRDWSLNPATLGVARDDLAPGVRSLRHGPYVVFFRYQPGVFEVARIIHGSRDIEAAW